MEKQIRASQSGKLGGGSVSVPRYAFDSLEWKAFWMRSIDSARIVWGSLTYEELLQTGGEPKRLAALIEKRYALSRGEANRQVHEFLGQCGTWS